jgi:hypothetical protein
VFDGTNLGVGVTPSAWSGGPANEIKGLSLWANSTNGGYSVQNAFYNGSNWIYKTTSQASYYLQGTGIHSWFTAPSGTAGNAISFTQSLALGKGTTLVLENGTSSSGTGIAFPATQNNSSDANTLDDYEEGTFTPSLIGSTSGSATSGGNTYGNYTKVGRLVTLNFVITISSVNTLVGNVKLSGLPFNLAAGATTLENRYPQGATIYGSLNTLWASVVIGSDGGTTSLAFTGTKIPATATTSVTGTDLTSSTFFAGSIQYITST